MSTSPSELSVRTFVEWYKVNRRKFSKALRTDRSPETLQGLLDELDDFMVDYAK